MKENNLVKMIWDFRGPNAGRIAEHHATHLQEFSVMEKLDSSIVSHEKLTDMHHIAFMVVDESLVSDLRERLKPNRGQRYKN